MPARPILVDTTRLLTRLRHASPSGIDRVDLAYAGRFLTGAPDRKAVAIAPTGGRILPDPASDHLMRTIRERWREDVRAEDDPVLADLKRRLSGWEAERPVAPPTAGLSTGWPKLQKLLLDGAAKANALRWPEAGAKAPPGAIYLHTSHLRLDKPQRFEWLAARPDVRPVFFLHDLIPIDFPEYAVPGEDARHRVRLATMSRHAAAVIANSRDVESRFVDFLAAEGWRVPPTAVAPLGVEPAFLREIAPAAVERPYVVVCSTIEARKNHAFLLQLWRDLLASYGEAVPALVVVGRRGWEAEAAIDLLERCPALRGHVFETAGLSTAGLAELVAGARALLMPSFAEGYGIPIVEALSLGTPAIVSDIPVHREVAGEHATFLHPLDGPGWAEAILQAGAEAARVAGYVPPTWDAHFALVDDVLSGL